MATIVRLLLGTGLLALGYYVGREVGRLESIREEMHGLRESVDHAGNSCKRVSAPSHADI